MFLMFSIFLFETDANINADADAEIQMSRFPNGQNQKRLVFFENVIISD